MPARMVPLFRVFVVMKPRMKRKYIRFQDHDRIKCTKENGEGSSAAISMETGSASESGLVSIWREWWCHQNRYETPVFKSRRLFPVAQ